MTSITALWIKFQELLPGFSYNPVISFTVTFMNRPFPRGILSLMTYETLNHASSERLYPEIFPISALLSEISPRDLLNFLPSLNLTLFFVKWILVIKDDPWPSKRFAFDYVRNFHPEKKLRFS